MESRIIKFRAWDGTKMIHPETTEGAGSSSEIYVMDFMGRVSLINQFGLGMKPVDVLPNITLMQSIGLTDKNGKEIYEGDIAKVHLFIEELGMNFGVIEGEREYMGVIEFWEYGIALNVGDNENNFYLTLSPGMLHEESFDIIGNKFENPELLNP